MTLLEANRKFYPEPAGQSPPSARSSLVVARYLWKLELLLRSTRILSGPRTAASTVILSKSQHPFPRKDTFISLVADLVLWAGREERSSSSLAFGQFARAFAFSPKDR